MLKSIIDFSKINESEGTIYFNISKGNLFLNDNYISIIKDYKNKTVFVLDRVIENGKYILRFVQSNPNIKTKICKLDITNFKEKDNFIITITWSAKNNLYFGTDSEDLIKTESVENENLNFRVGKDGDIYQVGDENIMVKGFSINVGGETVLEASAIEKYEMQREKINQLFENSQIKDYLFETTIYQQIIVMLVIGIEVYGKTRFLELLDEKIINSNAIINTFISKKYTEYIVELNTISSEKEKVLKIVDDKLINFQDFDKLKKAFNKGFGINTGNINNLENLKKLFNIRHKIIHTKNDMTILNIDEMVKFSEQPKFMKNEYIKESIEIVDTFINAFHQKTL
ncbi:hypothetical protein [Candidatus Absconditicoccus praedator]|uniref:hypothetical protein n=1 Tax=Candidatus Absconditicoccus praedator TaxID=2735562 RepID=UPI001E4A904B|nr:hypothetical protein [Candidatus Absconditicoccus praedator]UFX82601.1 hypothetical protein HLG78_00410 [Candidatus Absconditicoccus praedator]